MRCTTSNGMKKYEEFSAASSTAVCLTAASAVTSSQTANGAWEDLSNNLAPQPVHWNSLAKLAHPQHSVMHRRQRGINGTHTHTCNFPRRILIEVSTCVIPGAPGCWIAGHNSKDVKSSVPQVVVQMMFGHIFRVCRILLMSFGGATWSSCRTATTTMSLRDQRGDHGRLL